MKRRNWGSLELALGASLLIHAALLSLHWGGPRWPERAFNDNALEVILVNARTTERPTRAQAVAQANLAGGGEAQRSTATSPLPSAPTTQAGDAVLETRQRKLQNLQEQQQRLSQIREQLASIPAPSLAAPSTPPSPAQQAQEQQRQQLLKMLAQIEQHSNTENSGPRKRYISPATQEAAYALYYDRLRTKIETKGTDNFPSVNGQKLYGELTMLITINADGRLLQTEVIQSSGNRVLDQRARAIVENVAPFGAFNAAMRRQADQILVISKFSFQRDETLQTRTLGE